MKEEGRDASGVGESRTIVFDLNAVGDQTLI